MPKTKKNPNTKTAQIWLPYFKQGDDMHRCIVNENGKINAKASIKNHINLLNCAIDLLNEINKSLPDGMDFDISGDTHSITLTGDKTIIEKLQANSLLQDDDGVFDNESSSGSDNDDDTRGNENEVNIIAGNDTDTNNMVAESENDTEGDTESNSENIIKVEI
jgi:hypothetical protein